VRPVCGPLDKKNVKKKKKRGLFFFFRNRIAPGIAPTNGPPWVWGGWGGGNRRPRLRAAAAQTGVVQFLVYTRVDGACGAAENSRTSIANLVLDLRRRLRKAKAALPSRKIMKIWGGAGRNRAIGGRASRISNYVLGGVAGRRVRGAARGGTALRNHQWSTAIRRPSSTDSEHFSIGCIRSLDAFGEEWIWKSSIREA